MRNSIFLQISIVTFVLVSIIGCSGEAISNSTPVADPLGNIAQISEQRSKAEEWTKVLKANWDKDTKEYKEGEALYIEAKAAFDGWLDQLKIDLISGNTPNAETYETTLDEAVIKSDAFIDYVGSLRKTEQQGSSTSTPVVAIKVVLASIIVEAVVDAGVKLWEEYQSAKQEKRQEIINMLENLKWQSFNDI